MLPEEAINAVTIRCSLCDGDFRHTRLNCKRGSGQPVYYKENTIMVFFRMLMGVIWLETVILKGKNKPPDPSFAPFPLKEANHEYRINLHNECRTTGQEAERVDPLEEPGRKVRNRKTKNNYFMRLCEKKIIECVPNFSEGRDMEIIRQITNAIESVKGVKLLDVDPGKRHKQDCSNFCRKSEKSF